MTPEFLQGIFRALRLELQEVFPHVVSSSIPVSPTDVRDVQARISKGWRAGNTFAKRDSGAANIVYNTSDQYRRVLIQPELTEQQRIQWNPGQLIAIVRHSVDSGETIRRIELLPWGTAVAVPAGVVSVDLVLTSATDPTAFFPVPELLGCAVSVAYGVPERHIIARSTAQVDGNVTQLNPPDFAIRQRVSVSGSASALTIAATNGRWTANLDSLETLGTPREIWFAAQPVALNWTAGVDGLVSVEWECEQ